MRDMHEQVLSVQKLWTVKYWKILSMLFYKMNWKYFVWNKNDDWALLAGTSDFHCSAEIFPSMQSYNLDYNNYTKRNKITFVQYAGNFNLQKVL